MTFDWEEYQDLAEDLIRRRGDPAAERAAVSRSYYAVFNIARESLTVRGERFALTGEDHFTVWQWFRRQPDERLVDIGRDGVRLRKARRNCDYDSVVLGLSTDAPFFIELGRSMLSRMRSLL